MARKLINRIATVRAHLLLYTTRKNLSTAPIVTFTPFLPESPVNSHLSSTGRLPSRRICVKDLVDRIEDHLS